MLHLDQRLRVSDCGFHSLYPLDSHLYLLCIITIRQRCWTQLGSCCFMSVYSSFFGRQLIYMIKSICSLPCKFVAGTVTSSGSLFIMRTCQYFFRFPHAMCSCQWILECPKLEGTPQGLLNPTLSLHRTTLCRVHMNMQGWPGAH